MARETTWDLECGFALLEVAISLAVFSVLLATVFAVGVETQNLTSDNDLDASVQSEANRAFKRLGEQLRKTGRNTDAGTEYPRVLASGSELEFRVLVDTDGNGTSYNETTGDLEWSSNAFKVKRDAATDTVYFYDGTTPVWTLGRYIESINFKTVVEDNTLALNEVNVTIVARRIRKNGVPITYTVSGSVFMRN